MGIFDYIKHKDKKSSSQPNQENAILEEDAAPTFPLEYKEPSIDEWEKLYLDKLPEGIKSARNVIVKYFEARGELDSVTMVPAPQYPPCVQHLAIVYKGNVYSILVELVDERGNYIRNLDASIQMNVCGESDMIPCVLPLDYNTFEPIVGGCHLISTDKRTPITITPRNGEVVASHYEIQTFGLYEATIALEKQGMKIIQMCDIPGVQPNIVYENELGVRGYALCVTISYNTRKNIDFKIYEDVLKTYPKESGIYLEVFAVPQDKERIVQSDKSITDIRNEIFHSPDYTLFRESPLYHSVKRAIYIEDALSTISVDYSHKIVSTSPNSLPQTIVLEDLVETWKLLDACIVEKHLSPHLQYNSAWVPDTIIGKKEYLDYLNGKFQTLIENGNIPIVETIEEDGRSCIGLTQKENNISSVLDFEVQNGMIVKLLMRPPLRILSADDDWSLFAARFYHFLPRAIQIAGQSINEVMKKRGVPEREFTWIQTNYCHPTFQHLCFRLGNDVYSVIIGLHGFSDKNDNPIDEIVIPNSLRELQIRECSKNNLIPCIFPICAIPQIPLLGSPYLIHTETHRKIELNETTTDKKVPMSEWEIHDMGISAVIQYLQKEGFEVDGHCNLLEADPQITFTDKNGKSSFVIVNTITENTKANNNKKINHQLIMNTLEHNGYYAKVGLFPAAAIAYDSEGKMVPLSERDNIDDPKGMLYRGEGAYVFFKGLEYIEQVAANEGTNDNPVYRIQ